MSKNRRLVILFDMFLNPSLKMTTIFANIDRTIASTSKFSYTSLPIFTANETITNLTQHELSQEESDLLKAGLYFSIQRDKIQKSEIFTNFEKIHRSFINNLKSEETKSQIKAHLLCLANSYFYNYKPSPRILRQHRVLRNMRKIKISL